MGEKGHPILEKIDQLIEKFNDPAYPDDLVTIKTMRSDAEDLLSREALCQNEALKKIVRKYVTDIESFDVQLRNEDSKTLPDVARDRLIDKKKLYSDFVSQFDEIKIREELLAVDKEVAEQFAHLNL